ncbi:MAG TPA: phosphoglycerate kinase [Acidimicrobiales bacterium]|nr:MAG: hypothetical protein B7X07_05190 [Actinobacteria bacterium 21-64-8]HQT99886.1 phosphoglycerate kinase [Acidimicrobiales bacterium]
MSSSLPSHERWGRLDAKRVLVRADLNAPVAATNGVLTVTDDFRLRQCVPLLQDLQSRGADVVVCTHFGRPAGHVVDEYRVTPLRQRLNELCPGVTLLENLRFFPGEEANDYNFGATLIDGFDYYINEAFGASHRAHASIMVPPTLVPSAAGPNLQRETETLLSLLQSPFRPFVAIVGGAKVKDKLALVRVLSEKADTVIVGGGMAYTFALAEGRSIGESLVDESFVDECAELLSTGRVLIPHDARGLRSGQSFGRGGPDPVVNFGANIPSDSMGLDIGPESASQFVKVIETAATILWNGPMGVFEDPRFIQGTAAIARAVAASSASSVVGGGDSVAALQSLGLHDEVSFVSTGGGASLELVEHGDLPGLRALRESPWNS